MLTKILLVIWPLLVSTCAWLYKKKQNGPNCMTGGPISTPKSFWLAYTVTTWFFLPFLFIISPTVILPIKYIIYFHLLSWWARGPLELVMIYKWFNWTPKYGISHDLFHIVGLVALYYINRNEIVALNPMSNMAIAFIFVTTLATVAEISFAYLFLKARSEAEEKDNIYFASDDPKWIFINRLTLVVVCGVMAHLICQAVYALLVL